MSMKDTACSGYTLKAEHLTPHLPLSIQEDFKRHIELQDTEAIETLLGDHLPEGFPPFSSVFIVNDEMTQDDWEVGDVIVDFDEADLFEKTPTDALKAMRKADCGPSFSRWTVFG